MTIETEIAALTDATTDLLTAVNVSKATLDAKVDEATDQADIAVAQVALTTAQAGIATTKAGEALTSANNAANSATQAAASAASASAIVLGVSSGHPSIKPSLNLDFANTKRLDPRITFTRASTGTYYDGKTVAKAEENLLTYSQQFDNAAWSKTGATVAADSTTAPDGTATAEKLNETATASTHVVIQSATVQATPYTASVYLKAAERGFALFSYSVSIGVSVDLATGAATSAVGSPTNITSTDAGNGWWRVSFTFTPIAGSTTINIYVSTDGVWANRSYAGADGSGIYAWGAQLEARSSAAAYTPTTTQPITNYIPVLQTAAAGVPRFDHNPVTGESLGLLIEEQRANLLTYSEQFSNAIWTKTNATISANTVVAPDRTLTGDKLVENTATGAHSVYRSAGSLTGAYTFTAYVKAAERSWCYVEPLGTGTTRTYFNLSGTGAVGTTGPGVTASIASVGNGWLRISATYTYAAETGYCAIGAANGASGVSYAGDGYSGIYIWGAQLEAGAFATSYIKTEASQVTRSADAAIMTGTNFSSWYRADEGTVYAEAVGRSTSNASIFTIRDSLVGYVDQMSLDRTAAPQGRFNVRANNAQSCSISGATYTANTFAKQAGAYRRNNFAHSFNGAAAGTDTEGLVSLAVDSAHIGRLGSSQAEYLNGTIKKIAFYPARLTNSQLQALTA